MRNTPEALMIFAAGFGTRMKHLTQSTPKPLIEVAGKALIDHALELTKPVDLRTIVANLHYLPEQLEAHLDGSGVKTLRETPVVLETGAGLRHALPLLGTKPVFTMNPDALWSGPNPLTVAQTAWNPDEMDALLVCVPVENALGYSGTGDFALGANGQMKRGAGAVYGGVQIIKTDLLHDIREQVFSLNLLWDVMQGTNRLYGVSYPGQWCDVGHPEGIKLAEDMIAERHV